ncbi:hypothetical protein RIR_jg15600.t1 [Rhizophagus irregularis DAOM 181602=DAOM 197198]|nr:hypothetical protein RIR_jg15600.t1 [Rhizophagus irregularis DAOM 181602=DAOM 197198]
MDTAPDINVSDKFSVRIAPSVGLAGYIMKNMYTKIITVFYHKSYHELHRRLSPRVRWDRQNGVALEAGFMYAGPV